MSLGPFDLSGGPFLLLYGGLLVLTIIAGFTIPRWLRPEGRAPRNLDTDHLAYLAGGSARFTETVVARMLAGGQLERDDKDRYTPTGRGGATSIERSVQALPEGSGWSRVAGAIVWHADEIRQRLIADQLLIGRWEGLQLRFFQTLPYLLLLGVGYAKLLIGEARGKPVGYLTLFLILTAILALIRFLALDRRTEAGQDALAEAREHHERLRRAPASDEIGMGVALFGTVVLLGSDWGGFHQARATSSSGGDSSSSSSDGGGDSGGGSSGCGGGGCGGCGS